MLGKKLGNSTVKGFAVTSDADLKEKITRDVESSGFRILKVRKEDESALMASDTIVWTNAIVWGD